MSRITNNIAILYDIIENNNQMLAIKCLLSIKWKLSDFKGDSLLLVENNQAFIINDSQQK